MPVFPIVRQGADNIRITYVRDDREENHMTGADAASQSIRLSTVKMA